MKRQSTSIHLLSMRPLIGYSLCLLIFPVDFPLDNSTFVLHVTTVLLSLCMLCLSYFCCQFIFFSFCSFKRTLSLINKAKTTTTTTSFGSFYEVCHKHFQELCWSQFFASNAARTTALRFWRQLRGDKLHITVIYQHKIFVSDKQNVAVQSLADVTRVADGWIKTPSMSNKSAYRIRELVAHEYGEAEWICQSNISPELLS